MYYLCLLTKNSNNSMILVNNKLGCRATYSGGGEEGGVNVKRVSDRQMIKALHVSCNITPTFERNGACIAMAHLFNRHATSSF